MNTGSPEQASGGWMVRRLGCGALAGLGVVGVCCLGIVALMGPPHLLGEPPAFHNTVYRNDRMLFSAWLLDGVDLDGRGAAIAVDLHREYVLIVLADASKLVGNSSYIIDGRRYTIELEGAGDVTGVVTDRTIEVVDARTQRRTTTPLEPGEAFEWMAAKRRSASGDASRPDLRALLHDHHTPIPAGPGATESGPPKPVDRPS